jgi:hypothetical protein
MRQKFPKCNKNSQFETKIFPTLSDKTRWFKIRPKHFDYKPAQCADIHAGIVSGQLMKLTKQF